MLLFMGGHGWAHVMLWMGIGRCWWLWSGYGYKFEGKCWPLLNSSQEEGQTLVYQTFLSRYLADQKFLVCIWRISRVLLQHQTHSFLISTILFVVLKQLVKSTTIWNLLVWKMSHGQSKARQKSKFLEMMVLHMNQLESYVYLLMNHNWYVCVCVCVTNKGHNTNHEFVDYPHRYVDKKICSHPMTHFIFIEWRWLWTMS